MRNQKNTQLEKCIQSRHVELWNQPNEQSKKSATKKICNQETVRIEKSAINKFRIEKCV